MTQEELKKALALGQDQAQNKDRLLAGAVLITLNIRQWSARKFAKSATMETIAAQGAQDGAARVNKSLIARTHLQHIQALKNKAFIYHYEHTLPWLDNGARCLPVAKIDGYTETMREIKDQFGAAIQGLIGAYPDLVADARALLGRMFNPGDYPAQTNLAGLFAFNFRLGPIPTEDDFRAQLSQAQLSQARAETAQAVDQATRVMIRDLWARMAEPLKNMAAILGNPQGRVHDSLLGKMAEICAALPALNVFNDQGLVQARREIEALLAGTDTDSLRHDKAHRKLTADKAQNIVSALAGAGLV